jgi:glycogen synthase
MAQMTTISGHRPVNKQRLERLHLEIWRAIRPDGAVGLVGRMAQQKGLDLAANKGECAAISGQIRGVGNGALRRPGGADGRGLQRRPAAIRLVFFRNDFDMAVSKLLWPAATSPSFLRFEPCGIVDYESALLGTLSSAA